MKDAPVVVEGPKTISFKNWAHLEDRVKVKASAEDDLRALGFKVLARAQGQGELTLELRAIDFRNTSAAATRDGEVLDQFEFATTDQPCWSVFGPNMPENLRCTARAMVQAFVDSPRVAEAARKWKGRASASAPAPAAASPGQPRRLDLHGKLAVLELRNLLSQDLTAQNARCAW